MTSLARRRRRRLLPKPEFISTAGNGPEDTGWRPNLYGEPIRACRIEDYEAFEQLGPMVRAALNDEKRMTNWSAIGVLQEIHRRKMYGKDNDVRMAMEIVKRDAEAAANDVSSMGDLMWIRRR